MFGEGIGHYFVHIDTDAAHGKVLTVKLSSKKISSAEPDKQLAANTPKQMHWPGVLHSTLSRNPHWSRCDEADDCQRIYADVTGAL